MTFFWMAVSIGLSIQLFVLISLILKISAMSQPIASSLSQPVSSSATGLMVLMNPWLSVVITPSPIELSVICASSFSQESFFSVRLIIRETKTAMLNVNSKVTAARKMKVSELFSYCSSMDNAILVFAFDCAALSLCKIFNTLFIREMIEATQLDELI